MKGPQFFAIINLFLFCYTFKLGSRRISRHNDFKAAENEDSFGDSFEIVGASRPSSSYSPTPANSPLRKTINKVLAAVSLTVGSVFATYQSSSVVSGISLLKTMEKESTPLQAAVCNNKPTIIEFYADWCTSCKKLAPSMRAMELKVGDKVNFITLDAMKRENAKLVDLFRVDGIPHVAFLTKEKKAETALVGEVPKAILDEEIQALINGKELPYYGYDAFEGRNHKPFEGITESKICSI